MTDPRPSENTESIPQWPGFRAAGFFDQPTDEEPVVIDHQAEAQRLIDAGIDWVDPGNAPNSTAQLAQIHATLALVEQQRLANLIAYATHRIEHTDATGPRDIAPALRKMLASVDVAIRLELGLA